LLPLGIDSKGVIRWITDFERSAGFEKSAREKKTKEGEEPRTKKCADADPGKAPASLVDFGVLGADSRDTAAFDVPTAGVPTYLLAGALLGAASLVASGFCLTGSVSGPAMSPSNLM
jgi:hypothetical protein